MLQCRGAPRRTVTAIGGGVRSGLVVRVPSGVDCAVRRPAAAARHARPDGGPFARHRSTREVSHR